MNAARFIFLEENGYNTRYIYVNVNQIIWFTDNLVMTHTSLIPVKQTINQIAELVNETPMLS